MFTPPRKYSDYVRDIPKSIDWILKQIWTLKSLYSNSGGTGMTIDGGSFSAPNNAYIDGGSFN